MANQSVIVVGITLVWRKAVAAIHINSYKTILALIKFGGQPKNRQTTKLKSPPNKLRIRDIVSVALHPFVSLCLRVWSISKEGAIYTPHRVYTMHCGAT